MGSVAVGLNGFELWAYVVELDDGLRLRVSLDERQKLNLAPGQRIPVRLPGKADVWLFVTSATELPPVVRVTMVMRVRAAG